MWLAGSFYARAQTKTNLEEAKVQPYQLPHLLTNFDGTPVKNKTDWEKKRRQEILNLYSREVHGITPSNKLPVKYQLISEDKEALGGKAIRREVKICFSESEAHCVNLLLYVPLIQQPVPVFLGLNFEGNHSVYPDPGIQLNPKWMPNNNIRGLVNNHATEASRGARQERWQVEKIINRGYGLATIYYGDFELDRKDRSGKDGIRTLFPVTDSDDEWGTIAVWAWGLSRALDYLETDKSVNSKQVAVMGHSRLGKAAIWAAAQDTRFAMMISNNSGEGGAALSRRNFGETIADLNRVFGYWFSNNYKKYGPNPGSLPTDAHMLLTLMAPRPIYVASATEDLWADPRGEYLSAFHTAPVYQLYGLKGLTSEQMPGPDSPVSTEAVGYHLRTGEHNVKAYDWDQYLNFADRQFRKK